MGEIRQFDSGATRDTDEGKLAYTRFFSPEVLERRAEYMQRHRVQSDGALRDPDNWKRGIPPEAYMESLGRHFVDVWQLWVRLADSDYDVGRDDAWADFEEELCALMFNAEGLLYERIVCNNPH